MHRSTVNSQHMNLQYLLVLFTQNFIRAITKTLVHSWSAVIYLFFFFNADCIKLIFMQMHEHRGIQTE